ncbi:MAG: HAD family hydrolase [Bacteriovoracaceae bacterium]|nr:HAD family hydrolase [Bacteriovoracaceae bacterium]
MKYKDRTIKAVFFDMGNTLLDFHQGISDSNKDWMGAEAIAKYLSFISNQQISQDIVWEGFVEKWLSVMPQRSKRVDEFNPYDFLSSFLENKELTLTKEKSLEILKLCDVGYKNHLVVLPGAKEVLIYFKELGVKIGVISNSPQVDEVNIDHFKSTGLDDYIDKYIFSHGAKCRKPSFEIFQLAVDKFNVKSNECLMIGDGLENDIHPAKKIGMEAIHVGKKSEMKSLEQLLGVFNE